MVGTTTEFFVVQGRLISSLLSQHNRILFSQRNDRLIDDARDRILNWSSIAVVGSCVSM